MTILQVSDLFKVRGTQFDYQTRVDDQNKLVQRLRETNVPELLGEAQDIEEFTVTGIASIVYLEMMLERITKICSQKNISMS